MKKTVLERFFAKVVRSGECVIWVAAKNEAGYGVFAPHGTRTRLAHRWLYETLIGPIPSGLDLMHSCDTPACVALRHLTPGTRKQNMQDAASRGRVRRGEGQPASKLTVQDVLEIRRRYGAGESQSALAREFGVHTPAIHKIVHRLHWRHV